MKKKKKKEFRWFARGSQEVKNKPVTCIICSISIIRAVLPRLGAGGHQPKSIPWVKRIRDDMRNEMERHLLMAGIPTMLKPRGIGLKLLDNIIDVLIDSGNA